MLLRFVGRNDGERRVALNIIGPRRDGNHAWFIPGSGAIMPAAVSRYYPADDMKHATRASTGGMFCFLHDCYGHMDRLAVQP